MIVSAFYFEWFERLFNNRYEILVTIATWFKWCDTEISIFIDIISSNELFFVHKDD